MTGQIDNGGWAFTYSLTPIYNDDVCYDEDPYFILNEQNLSLKQVRKISCYLGHYNEDMGLLSPHQHYCGLIKSEKKQITEKELCEIFGLTESRWNRPFLNTGNEVWRISAALGFAQGKKIYCFPWMTNRQITSQLNTIRYLGDFFKHNDCYLFLPVENEELIKGVTNNIIDLSQPQLY